MVATPGGPATVEEFAARGTTAQQAADAVLARHAGILAEPAGSAAELLPVVHPSWCDPQLCTAKPTPPFEQYATIPAEQRKAMDFGRHMSALVDEPGAAKLQVTRQVAAWRTSTYVNVSEWYEGAGAAHVTVTELALALAVSGLLPEIEETVALYAQPPGGTEFDRHAALVAFAAQVMVATDTRRDEDPAETVAAITAAVDRLGVVLGWTR